MAVDTDYLDDLMKSIEPAIYPDGVPGEETNEDEKVFGEGEEFADAYEMELASIPEKDLSDDVEKQVESAIEALDGETDRKDVSAPAEEMTEEIPDGVEHWDEINTNFPSAAEEVEIDMSMSEEEIDAMLNAAKNSAIESEVKVNDSDDVTDLLAMFDDDSDLKDIKETLVKADNNIAIDQSALEEKEIVIPDLDEEEQSEEVETKKGKKPKKSKDKKKDADTAEEKANKKKGGLLSKIISALTEEVQDDVVVPEQLETGVTDENAQILSELDSEDKGKKKKKKKDKKSKGSKGQAETQGDERDIREKSDDEDEGGGKGKDKKGKKPKKEKKPKEKKEKVPEKPEKKLPKKRVRNTFILCLSILAAVLILSFFANDFISKRNARYAFDNQQYDVAYEELYGMNLNESDGEIYEKSKTIMILQRKITSHDNYMQLGMKAEALNALLEGFDLYPAVLEKAQSLGVEEKVNEEYDIILSYLAGFGVSSSDAVEINNYTSSVKYNKRILSIVNNSSFEYSLDNIDNDGSSEAEEVNVPEKTLEDILPEEEDFLPDNPEDIYN